VTTDRYRFVAIQSRCSTSLDLRGLDEAGSKALQMSEGHRFFDESQRQSFAQGRVAAKVADVLDVLDARGLEVTEAQRQRVLGCSDLETLARWLRRAVTVASTDAVFDEVT
jgi:hypothetical protein